MAVHNPAPGGPGVVARGVSFAWPSGRPLWTPLSFELEPGLTVLVGGDGAGKTTLLRLLAAELQPTQGQLAWQTALPEAERPSVFWCNPASTERDAWVAADYLAHHQAHQPRWNPELLNDLLDELELSDHLHKPLHGLSMGMRRKLRLAAGLASEARLTLFDDPLAALDHRSARVVSAWLRAAAESTQRLVVATAFDRATAEDWGAGLCIELDPLRV